MLSRLIRGINAAIGLIFLSALIAVYWYAIRPLPKISGSIAAPIASAATVKRDVRGVPHVEAASWQDAIFLQGYVTAQDRLWQMDSMRRFGTGELAEVFGPPALEQDKRSRRMQLRPIAEASYNRLPPEEKAVFIEYARGVNYFIRTHLGNYGLEFSLPGHSYDPRPWRPEDSLVAGIVMYRDQTDTATLDQDRGELFAHASNVDHMRQLFPPVSGALVSPGSNAWAVSGAHTANGKPLLANDPHLSVGIPPTWYMIHLKAPGLNVTGVSLPGVPGVLAGHNGRIAWGFTSLEADVMDLYREKMDLRSGRYIYDGRVQQAQRVREVIGVRGAAPVTVDLWVTRHGPVVEAGEHEVVTMRWSAQQGATFPFWDIDRAQNWTDFQRAARDLAGPALNFVYADIDGNIGYQAAGFVPVRKGFDGETPLDGSSSATEWSGFIAPEQLPSFFNPNSGMIATANQDPFPPNYPAVIPGGYHGRYRIGQIFALLKSKPKFAVPDMLAIQKDVYSAYDFFLAQQALGAIRRKNTSGPLLREAAPILLAWNGQMEKSEAAPLIVELLNDAIETDLVARNTAGAVPNRTQPRPSAIETLLRTRPPGWVSGDDWDAWVLARLSEAIQIGRRLQGTPLSHWQWGRLLQWNFQHAIGKQLPFVDRFFDIGPVEMSGSSTTVKQTLPGLGPSERMVVDLGDLDASVQNLPTGESGAVASPHYKDEWPAYYAGTSFPMQYRNVDAKDTLRVQPSHGDAQ